MAGQGSRRRGIIESRCGLLAPRHICAQALFVSAFLISSAFAAERLESAPPVDVKILVELQAPEPQPWNVRLHLVDPANGHNGGEASIGELRNLSTSSLTSGIFDLDAVKRTLSLLSRHPIAAGKFEVRVRGSREATLRVEMFAGPQQGTGERTIREIPLVDLLAAESIASSDPPESTASKASWTIRRVGGDSLRLEKLASVPVYPAGGMFELNMRANGMIDQRSHTHVLSYELYRVDDGKTVAAHRCPIQIDAYGNSEWIQWNESLPEVAGVYEIRVQIEPEDANIWSRLRRRPPPLTRVTRAIAILHKPHASDDETEKTPWDEVGVIRPSESNWSVGQWLPKQTTRLLPGASRPEIHDLERKSHADQSVSLLPPNATFQATLPVKLPGYPHKVTIRLPSNSRSDLQIQVGHQREDATTSFVLQADATADHQGPWREHTFVHFPAEGDQIWLTNLSEKGTASFESIAVKAGPLRLSSESAGESTSRTAALRLSDVDWIDRFSADLQRRIDLSSCARSTRDMARLWVAVERISDFARACGCNAIVVPANNVARTWYQSAHFAPTVDPSQPRSHHLEILLRLLEARPLRVIVGLKPNMLLAEIERAVQENESLLVQTTRRTPTGEPNAADDYPSDIDRARTQYHPLHPLVQQSLTALVGELRSLCDPYKSFSGILVDCEGNSHLRPVATNDTASVILFGRAHGVAGNLAEIRAWIQQQGQDSLTTWQTEQLEQVFDAVAKSGGVNRTKLLVPASNSTALDRNSGTAEHAAEDPTIASRAATHRVPNLVFSFRYRPAGVVAGKSLRQHQLSTARGPLTGILLGEERPADLNLLVRDQTLGDLSRLIGRTDPNLLILDISLVETQLDERLTATLGSFCAFPQHGLRESSPVDSASHTVRLRSGTFDGHFYVSMVSVVPWDCDVDLELQAPTEWEVIGRDRVETADRIVQSSRGARSRVLVPAGEVVLMRGTALSDDAIRSWTTRVSGGTETTESIKQKVTLIIERIGILSDFARYDELNNGGFEEAGDVGLVGWLHAQHPPGCVRVDEEESVEGSRSVLLTTATPMVTRTWLVSETIDPPPSGRLAVSLAYRAEAGADDATHLFRVSIEATRLGDPIRFARDVQAPCNGQWSDREVILEVDEVDPSSIESLRLTIDSLSGGRVWIDDVQLHDRFPTAGERADLESQAFLALQGLQRGNLLPSGRLLQNHWARHLLTLEPTVQAKKVIEEVAEPGRESASEEPGVAERIRSWLPVPLRF